MTRPLAWLGMAQLAQAVRTRAVAFPLLLFISLRVWFSFWAAVAVLALSPAPATRAQYWGMTPLGGGIDQVLWAPWQRWDTIWYTKIAEQGYSTTDLTTAFFPLYPLLVKIVSPLFLGNTVAAGVIVSSVAAFAAFILFYRWTEGEFGAAAAERALVYLALFPSAFFLFAAYTESLFLALALAAFILARRGHWAWAGIVGALVALTRSQGLLIALPLAVELWQHFRRGKCSLWNVLYLVPVGAAGAAWFLYLFQLTGSMDAWFNIEKAWRVSAWPWEPVLQSIYKIVYSGDPAAILLNLIDLGSLLLACAIALWCAWKRRWAEAIYIATIIFPPLFTIARYSALLPLGSMARFVVVAFPVFAWLGTRRLAGFWPKLLLVPALLLQILLLILFTQWFLIG